jgi:GT2 family glycosyltransferase
MMPTPDAALPKPSATALRTLATVRALADTDPAAARALALPLLGQPVLHVQALALVIELSKRLGDGPMAAAYARRAARLAPKNPIARNLAASALREAGFTDEALSQALAALALAPADTQTQIGAVQAAAAAGRPQAGLSAALGLLRAPGCVDAFRLAAGLLDACAGGAPWGAAWLDGQTVTGCLGCLRCLPPTPPEVLVLCDGVPVGRAVADSPLAGLAAVCGFSLALPPGLAGANLEAVLAATGQPLFGSPLPVPEAPASPVPHAAPGAGSSAGPAGPADAAPPGNASAGFSASACAGPSGRFDARCSGNAAAGFPPTGPAPFHTGRQPALSGPSLAVDVVVPVYKGLAETRACLESVLRAGGGTAWRLVVVNDCSPDPQLTAWLRQLAGTGCITLLENATNQGFPATANRGMAHGPNRDVVLLNSDALVFDGWLDRLAAAAYAAPDIGTATPFSNNATICSYPSFNGDNPLPPDCGPAGLDRLFAQVNAGRVCDLPTAVGFCMYIRRDCLQAVDDFDAAAFGRGYGEENDFCRRAAASGWRHVLCADVFVVHAGGASFGATKDAALARNLDILAARHPDYLDLVAAFTRADPALPLRRAVDMARLMRLCRAPLVVRLCHGRDGGTARRLAEEAAELAGAGYDAGLLAPANPEEPDSRVRLTLDGAPPVPNLVYDLPSQWSELLTDLRALGTVGLIIHHFLDLPDVVLDLPEALGLPYEARVHDYAWFCPRITLIDDLGLPCPEPDAAACQRCVEVGIPLEDDLPPVAALLQRSARLLGAAGRVLAPSRDAAARMARHFPAARLLAAPHPEPAFAPPPVPAWLPWDGTRPLRLALIGALGAHKGYEVLLAMARDAARRELPLSFAVAGFTRDDFALFATGRVFVTGRFEEGQAAQVVRELHCQAALCLSVWPETWCYTLTEGWRAGLWTVGFDVGAVGERIAETGFGWRLPLTLSGREVNDRLLALFSRPPAPGSLMA